jgi:rhamnosyltransferase subunit B
MHAVLTPVGSAGDVNPFIVVGRELRRRGHRVTLLASEVFGRAASDAGLELVSVWSAAEFERATKNPDLFDPRRGPAVVFGAIRDQLRPSYGVLERTCDTHDAVIVGHPLSFYARVFEDVHRVPAVTIDLAPGTLRSAYGPAALPGLNISRWPPWVRRGLWWALDRFAIDPMIAPTLNRWRGELGLAPISRVFDWMHSPQRIIGLFPDWFGAPQADWPPQTRLTGFALIETGALAPDVERFLDAGEPPVVFTPGSANRHAAHFFRTAVDATARLGRRALFVTGYADHLPSPLPAHVWRADYTSFTALFPRAAAVVHHGGVGTCAQGLAAGVPQLLMPMGFDQPDNALRVASLGVGTSIAPAHFSPPRVAAALAHLLTRADVATACRRWRDEVDSAGAVRQACDFIEQQHREPFRFPN